MTVNRIDGATPARISTNVTVGNQTANKSFGDKLNTGLQNGANALASGAALLGSAGVPGLGIVSAAVSSVTGHVGGASSAGYAATGVVNIGGGAGGSSPVSTTVGAGSIGGSVGSVGAGGSVGPNFSQGATSNDIGFGNNAMGSMQNDMSNMLKLQYSMQKENMMYTSISNVLKTKHETTKNSISNVR